MIRVAAFWIPRFVALVFAASVALADEARPRPASATITYDLEYGRAAGQALLLDASVPAGRPGPHPIAILVHGGGWSGGDKAMDITGFFQPLTEAGFIWFSINYRLAPAHRWPAPLEDLQTAIRWVKANAARFDGDPRRIALIGYSAGAQLAALAAIHAEETAPVHAVVGVAPALDLVADARRRGKLSPSLQNLLGFPETLSEDALERIRAISPAAQLRSGLPPFLLLQGDADKTVLPAHTAAFAEKLREAGGRCDLITIKDAPHRLADWNQFDTAYQRSTAAWLLQHLPASPR